MIVYFGWTLSYFAYIFFFLLKGSDRFSIGSHFTLLHAWLFVKINFRQSFSGLHPWLKFLSYFPFLLPLHQPLLIHLAPLPILILKIVNIFLEFFLPIATKSLPPTHPGIIQKTRILVAIKISMIPDVLRMLFPKIISLKVMIHLFYLDNCVVIFLV